MPDITIINASFPSSKPYTPIGSLIMVSILENDGFDVQFLDYQLGEEEDVVSPKVFSRYLEKAKSKLIGISTFANSLPTILMAVRIFKRNNPNVKFVLGGPGVSNKTKQILSLAPIDVIVRGEGEITGLEVFNNLKNGKPLNSITGITYRREQKIIRNIDRQLLQDIDQSPIPAYHHINFEKYNNSVSIITGRGCPYNCTFCAKPIWKKGVKYHSIDRVIKEIKQLSNDVEEINFCDDAFVSNRSRLLEFCEKYKNANINIPWECTGRIGKMDEEIVQKLKQAGCSTLFLGIESGSLKVLNKLNKEITPKVAREQINLCKKHFKRIFTSYMWGMPFESKNDFYETIMFMMEDFESEVVRTVFTLATPIPDTKLQQDYFDKIDFLEDNHYSGVTLPSGYNLSQYSSIRNIILEHPKLFMGFFYFKNPDFEEKHKFIDKLNQKNRRKGIQ